LDFSISSNKRKDLLVPTEDRWEFPPFKPIEKTKEILGEASNVRYLEESSMRKRLGDYLLENSLT